MPTHDTHGSQRNRHVSLSDEEAVKEIVGRPFSTCGRP